MPAWLGYSAIVIVLWGVVGVLQKLGSNHISSASLLVWLQVGYLALVPFLLDQAQLHTLGLRDILIGTLAGLVNGLGAWCLFAALRSGAKASVAVPVTALNPLLTAVAAVVFLDERLTVWQWLGGLLAIAAGVMLSYEDEPARVDEKCASR